MTSEILRFSEKNHLRMRVFKSTSFTSTSRKREQTLIMLAKLLLTLSFMIYLLILVKVIWYSKDVL